MRSSTGYNTVTSRQTNRGIRSILIGIIANTLLAFAKIITGILGHSHALIADGIESTMDIFSSTIVWGGLKVAAKPPDENHPYGHGKAENLAGLIVSLTLIGAGFVVAVQSILGMFTPRQVPSPYTLIVLVSVIVIKLTISRFQLKVGESIDSHALKTDAWHHRLDALTSMAAFVGISIAIIAGKGYESADDWAALFVSIIIAINGYRLFRLAISDIMDEAPDTAIEAHIRKLAQSVPGVVRVEKCRVRKSGLGYLVELHVEVDENISVRQGHDIAHGVKDALLHSDLHILDALIHIEPSRFRRDNSQDSI